VKRKRKKTNTRSDINQNFAGKEDCKRKRKRIDPDNPQYKQRKKEKEEKTNDARNLGEI